MKLPSFKFVAVGLFAAGGGAIALANHSDPLPQNLERPSEADALPESILAILDGDANSSACGGRQGAPPRIATGWHKPPNASHRTIGGWVRNQTTELLFTTVYARTNLGEGPEDLLIGAYELAPGATQQINLMLDGPRASKLSAMPRNFPAHLRFVAKIESQGEQADEEHLYIEDEGLRLELANGALKSWLPGEWRPSKERRGNPEIDPNGVLVYPDFQGSLPPTPQMPGRRIPSRDDIATTEEEG